MTPQIITQSPQTAPSPSTPGLQSPCPHGGRHKGPPKLPRDSERGSPAPGSCLSPSPSAAFTVVAIKCQLLGVRNNKHCNSAQSQHPLRVSEAVRPVTGRLRGPATPPASALSAPSVNRDGDRVAVALGQRMKGCRGMGAACSLPPNPAHRPRWDCTDKGAPNLLPIPARAGGALGAAHRAPNAAWSADTWLGLGAGQRETFSLIPRGICLGEPTPESPRDVGSAAKGTRVCQPEAGGQGTWAGQKEAKATSTHLQCSRRTQDPDERSSRSTRQ